MAREIHEREDLLRDARALVPRILIRVEINGCSVDVFAGFRGSSLSLYFGDDPAFHFNSGGELRRAFVEDRLIKAERGRLAALERKRTERETRLERVDLSAAAQEAFLLDVSNRIGQLAEALAHGAFMVLGKEPHDGDALPRLREWLSLHPRPAVAASPRID